MSKHGQDRFDGYSIDSYRGRFSGSFDVDPSVGEQIAYGDEVVIVVVAKVGKADITETAIGDMRRTNILKPTDVRFVLNGTEQTRLRENFGFDSFQPAPSAFLDETLIEDAEISAINEEIDVPFDGDSIAPIVSRDEDVERISPETEKQDAVLSRFLYSEV